MISDTFPVQGDCQAAHRQWQWLTTATGYCRIHMIALADRSVHYEQWKSLTCCVDHLEILPRSILFQKRALADVIFQYVKDQPMFDRLLCNSAVLLQAVATLPVKHRILDLNDLSQPGLLDRRATQWWPIARSRHAALRASYVQAARISQEVVIHEHHPHWMPMDREMAGKTRIVARDDIQAMAAIFMPTVSAPITLPPASRQLADSVRRAA